MYFYDVGDAARRRFLPIWMVEQMAARNMGDSILSAAE